MKKAVYPGSFDPITIGHLDIIQRSCTFIDKLTLAIIDNPNKSCLFSLKERKEIVSQVIRDMKLEHKIEVVSYSGLLVRFVKKIGANLIIRGLRAVSDFDYELKITMMNRSLDKDIETIHLMTDENHLFISSSLIKEVATLGGNVSNYLPDYACKKLIEKVKNLQ